jgi:hypothetical protein
MSAVHLDLIDAELATAAIAYLAKGVSNGRAGKRGS